MLSSCVTCSACALLAVTYTFLSAFVSDGIEMSHKCVNSVNNFCYIYGEITCTSRKHALTAVIKKPTSCTLVVKCATRTRAGLHTCTARPVHQSSTFW